MKKYSTLILLLIIVILSFITYKNWKSKTAIKIDIVDNTHLIEEDIIVSDSFETRNLDGSDTYVNYDVKYPYFKKADNDFNASIEKLLKDQIEESKQISKDNWQARFETQERGDDVSSVPVGEDKFSFFSDFTVIQSNSSYISAILKYGGFNGGAHGYENNIALNYDVKNKRVLLLKDVFPNNPKYLTYLSEESRVLLKKKFAYMSEAEKKNSTKEEIKEYTDSIITSIESGTEPKDENFGVFTFTKDKIKIYFGQYQVGPYTFGSPEVEIDIK